MTAGSEHRIALVLGAGGAPGWMWHAGVLEGLADRTGWDARRSDVIVGTSAGSMVGAALRAGMRPDDFADAVDHPPSPEERAVVVDEVRSRRRSLRPLSAGLARHVLPGGAGLPVALSGLAPAGLFPTWPLTGRGRIPMPTDWDRLWIPATRASDGARVVFGRDECHVSVPEAVEASCAFPGLFEPKRINGDRFIDGGAISPTHAQLAIDADVSLALISAPLSRPGARPLTMLARTRLAEERRRLRAAGIASLVVTPPPGAGSLFRSYPRRDRQAGSTLRTMGARAARRALTEDPAVAERLS